MKYNLKNRPKMESVWKNELSGTEDGYNSEAASIAGEMEEWFEDFQKELQEIMPSYERATINPYDNEKRRIIMEILGE